MQLSMRLQRVASYVPKDAVLADIGSDHAYLPLYLYQKGTIQKAIAGEVVRGPYEAAKRNVTAHRATDAITVRLANGLQAIVVEDRVTTVTIAGMGGRLITTILEEGMDQLLTVERLILQPNIHSEPIRQWAMENGWYIVAEEILKEDGHIYEIIVLERGEEMYSPLQLLVGPYLLQQKSEVFCEKWQEECESWKRVLQSLQQATQTEEIRRKQEILHRQIEQVEKVIQ